jgi:hypothetical protein
MAPAALGLSGASSHEPFHADGGQKSMAVTERSGQKTPPRRRDLPWSNRTVAQVVALPNRAVLGIKAAGSAVDRPARRAAAARPARSARLTGHADRYCPAVVYLAAVAAYLAGRREPRVLRPARVGPFPCLS